MPAVEERQAIVEAAPSIRTAEGAVCGIRPTARGEQVVGIVNAEIHCAGGGVQVCP